MNSPPDESKPSRSLLAYQTLLQNHITYAFPTSWGKMCFLKTQWNYCANVFHLVCFYPFHSHCIRLICSPGTNCYSYLAYAVFFVDCHTGTLFVFRKLFHEPVSTNALGKWVGPSVALCLPLKNFNISYDKYHPTSDNPVYLLWIDWCVVEGACFYGLRNDDVGFVWGPDCPADFSAQGLKLKDMSEDLYNLPYLIYRCWGAPPYKHSWLQKQKTQINISEITEV